jgi:ribonuclease E
MEGQLDAADVSGPSVAEVVGLVADAAPALDPATPVVREPRPPKAPREPRPPREARPPREQPPTALLAPVADVAAPLPPPVDEAPVFRNAPQIDAAPTASPPREMPREPLVQDHVEPMAPALPRPVPARPAVVPPVQLALPADSGLELVETRHAAPVEALADDAALRPKRVRPPRAEIVSEPLEIVETRKDAPPPA